MKFLITTYEGDSENALLQNISENPFTYANYIELSPKEEKEFSLSFLKMFFGDWENDSFGEKDRQKQSNSNLFDVQVQTVKREKKIENKQVFDEAVVEEEFASIKEKCKATTKAGNECKQYALPGSDYCKLHQK